MGLPSPEDLKAAEKRKRVLKFGSVRKGIGIIMESRGVSRKEARRIFERKIKEANLPELVELFVHGPKHHTNSVHRIGERQY